jgi:hypothetical protein
MKVSDSPSGQKKVWLTETTRGVRAVKIKFLDKRQTLASKYHFYQRALFTPPVQAMSIVVAYLLLPAYLVAGLWLFSKASVGLGFKPAFGRWFFLGKCAAGVLYTFVALRYIPNRGDMGGFFDDGYALYVQLWRSPAQWWQSVAQMLTVSDADITNTNSDYVRSAFEGIKFVHFVLNLFSGGNIYTNTVLFNVLSAWLMLRCWAFLRRQLHAPLMPPVLFLLPSCFFYTAGIHKEGLVFALLCTLLPPLQGLLEKRRWRGLMLVLPCLALMLFFKVFVGLIFLASVVLWVWLARSSWPKPRLVLVFSTSLLVLFFGLSVLVPRANLPGIVVQRRQAFVALEAASSLPMQPLQPTPVSFLQALPQALNHVLFKPLPGEGGKMMYLVFSAEMLAFWLTTLWLAFRRGSKGRPVHPQLWTLFFFGIANLLLIGYTIPNIGAIMRYRSIFMPCLALGLWRLLAPTPIVVSFKTTVLRFIYLPDPPA